MKKFTLLLLVALAFATNTRADVEWTIWEGSVTGGNAQGASKLDLSALEAGDIIYVYGSGTLSKAIYRISGNDWSTWTALQSYSPAVSDGDNYYHVITEDFLTNFNYSSDDTKSWAVGNWNAGTITKVTIRKSSSMIKTVLSTDSKSEDTFEYTIPKNDFAKMTAGDYIYLPASRRNEVAEKNYKVEFKEAEDDWTTYNTLWGPTHDIIWQVTSSTIDDGIKDHPLYVYGELYNVTGVYLYHPIPSFSIGSIGYATFSANQQVTAPASVTAYKATVNGGYVALTPFTNNVIPANTGAIIKGDEGAVLEFLASNESTSETSDLIACTSATDVTTLAESGYDLYVLYPGTGESEDELPLSTLLGNFGGWNPSITWNPSTYTATYTEQTGNGEGGWVGADWSAYDKLKLNFSANTLDADATFYVAYSGHDDATTQATLSRGSTSSIEIELNSDYKNAIGNFSMFSNATSGSITFESAALIDNDGATVAEFRKTTSGTLAANKAYLKIPVAGSGSSPARALRIVFGGDITEINSVEEKKPVIINDNVIYNLNGQVVTNPSNGIYIKNGKKFIVK